MNMSEFKCLICDSINPGFSWTDSHGVGQCFHCGAPYRIIHYDDKKNRIEKPPEITFKEEYIPLIREYFSAHQSRIPGGHSFPGGYELATSEESNKFNDWMEAKLKEQI
jgi:hypothetical protein